MFPAGNNNTDSDNNNNKMNDQLQSSSADEAAAAAAAAQQQQQQQQQQQIPLLQSFPATYSTSPSQSPGEIGYGLAGASAEEMGYGLQPFYSVANNNATSSIAAAAVSSSMGGRLGLAADYPTTGGVETNLGPSASSSASQQKHHIGKKPGSANNTGMGKKNKKRKPSTTRGDGKKTQNSGGSNRMNTTSSSVASSSRRPSLPRQGSSTSIDRRRLPKLIITNDEEPDRFTNPLLIPAATTVTKRISITTTNNSTGGVTASKSAGKDTGTSNTASGGAAAAAASVSGTNKNPATASSTTTTSVVVPSGELMNTSSIVYHKPDTYPLSFLARVLGFDVDVPDTLSMQQQQEQLVENHNGENVYENNVVPQQQQQQQQQRASLKNSLPAFPTELPDPETLPFKRDEIFMNIPKEGTYYMHKKFIEKGDGITIEGLLGDDDDRQTLDYMDPVYQTFLQHGWDGRRLKSIGSSGKLKFVHEQQRQEPIRERVVQMAREIMGLSEDWTFQDWASYTQEQEQQDDQKQKQDNTSSSSVTLNRTTTSVLESATTANIDSHQQPPDNNAKSRQGHYRRKNRNGPLWTIDGKQVFSHLPHHIFGILCLHKGKPVALLKYQFQWYYLPNPEQDGDWSNRGKVDPNNPLEAELIMTIDGFGHRASERNDATTDISNVQLNTTSNDSGDPTTVINTDAATVEYEREVSSPPTILGNLTSANDDEVALLSPLKTPIDNEVKTVMLAMAIEHTRACGVWYGLWNAPQSFGDEILKKCFRMVQLPPCSDREDIQDSDSPTAPGNVQNIQAEPTIPVICDVKKCSSRYALLKWADSDIDKEEMAESSRIEAKSERLLVNMPTDEEATSLFESSNPARRNIASRTHREESETSVFTSAVAQARDVTIKVRAKVFDQSSVEIYKVHGIGNEERVVDLPILAEGTLATQNGESGIERAKDVEDNATDTPKVNSERSINVDQLVNLPWKILKSFPIQDSNEEEIQDNSTNEVLTELEKKQKELVALEASMVPTARRLLSKAVSERIEFERPEARNRRADVERILKENDEHVARRKELDQAWQDQLEQDMNAVCSICNDGEVTPENQILFCEACNVAVHQNCYGIIQVPEGDYYCVACRYFKRDEQIQAMADSKRFKDPAMAPRTTLPPLPIVCELCPVKQGAFIRTETKSSTSTSSNSKWVHMACAKWHGLNSVPENDPSPSLVEDVSDLKRHFLINRTSCCICKGMRGAYYQCQFDGCTNWCHVSCARETRLCEVVFGLDVEGNEIKDGWQLKCPDHSTVKEIDGEIKKDAVSVDYLMKAANEFPPEQLSLRPNKPFTALTASERKLALLDNDYEQELIIEVMTKKICGFHCEVCDAVDENGKESARCSGCNAVVCLGCQFIDDPDMLSERYFKCIGCRSASSGEDPPTRPQCSLCNQKGGLLAWASANPINKKTYRKNNPKGSKKSVFDNTKHAHLLCAFWSKHMILHPATGSVDTSNTVLSNGRGHVQSQYRCGLCGLKTGLKTKCSDITCRARGERRAPYHFHISCARQAGLEVAHNDNHDPEYFSKFDFADNVVNFGPIMISQVLYFIFL